jgi:hypothetical protein
MARLLRLSSAVFVARHAGEALWTKVQSRVEEVCAEGLPLLNDPEYRGQHWLQYDAAAMAVAALTYALFRAKGGDLAPLLAAASAPSGAAVRAVRRVVGLLPDINPGLERSLIRLGLAQCVWAARPWEESDDDRHDRRRLQDEAAASRVTAELKWLEGSGPEPEWPVFPTEAQAESEAAALQAVADAAAPKDEDERRWRDPGYRQAGVDVENAGRWLEIAFKDRPTESWRTALIERYSAWTIEEIAGDDDDRRVSSVSRWVHAYFSALGQIACDLNEAQLRMLLIDPLARLSHEVLLTLAPDLLRGVDIVYFNGPQSTGDVPLRIRRAVYEAIKGTRPWRRMAGHWSTSLEMNLGPAVAALFFNSKDFSSGPKSYLLEPAMVRLDVFLDFLAEAAIEGAALAPAQCLLNTLDVAPRTGFTAPLLNSVEAWLRTFPSNVGFWVEQGIGRRAARLLDRLSDVDAAQFKSHRSRIDAVLVALIALGVPEAARLEERLFQA